MQQWQVACLRLLGALYNLLGAEDDRTVFPIRAKRPHSADASVFPAARGLIHVFAGYPRHFFTPRAEQYKEGLNGVNRIPGEVHRMVLLKGTWPPGDGSGGVGKLHLGSDLAPAQA